MKFEDTVAYSCRYGENAAEAFKGWDILWEDSEADYQGHASLLGKKGDEYFFYEWHYGSCSGCDGWESDGKTNGEVVDEMKTQAAYFKSKEELKNWLDMLEGNPRSNASMERGGGLAYGLDYLSGSLRGRINAIRKEMGMEPLNAD